MRVLHLRCHPTRRVRRFARPGARVAFHVPRHPDIADQGTRAGFLARAERPRAAS